MKTDGIPEIVYCRKTNTESDPLVREIQVSKQNSSIHVRAYFPDELKYNQGIAALGEIPYYTLEGLFPGINGYTISLETSNLKLSLFFINELIRISPGLATSGIIQKLESDHIQLNLGYESSKDIPIWHECILDPVIRRNPPSINQFILKNTSTQSKVRSIHVDMKSDNPTFNVVVQCSSDTYFYSLVSALVSHHIIRQDTHIHPRDAIHCYVDTREQATIEKLRLFVTQLQAFEPLLINAVRVRMCRMINTHSRTATPLIPINGPVLRDEPHHLDAKQEFNTANTYRPSTPPTPSDTSEMPLPGSVEQKNGLSNNNAY